MEREGATVTPLLQFTAQLRLDMLEAAPGLPMSLVNWTGEPGDPATVRENRRTAKDTALVRTGAARIAEFESVGLPVAVAVFQAQHLRPAARDEV
jgi:hypothetical protein